MRAILLTLVCFGGIGATFYAPFLGIVMWYWLSLMNPHRLTYGFTAGLPVIAISGAATIIMWVASSEPKKLPGSWLCRIFLLFIFWVSLTTVFAISPLAFDKWTEVMKILGMCILTIAVTTTRLRMVILVWIVAISIGFWGLKGGVFSLVTGGAHRTYGPPGTFIGDNNQFGLALVMTLPICVYLSEIVKNYCIRIGMLTLTGFIVISTLMTYSRGAAIGLVSIGVLVWWSSRRRMVSALTLSIVVAVGSQYLPAQWYARMDTLNEYETEESAASRLVYWAQGWAMAQDSPILGHGFKAFLHPTALNYRPDSSSTRLQEAHSIYFQILGEQGFVGFAIFICILFLHLRATRRIYVMTESIPDLFWAHRLSRALFLSGVAFAVSGAFLSQAYYDLYYLIVCLGICLARIVNVGEFSPRGDRFPQLLDLLRIDAADWGLTGRSQSFPLTHR